MCRRKLSDNIVPRMQLLMSGVVLWAMVSVDHLALGFSSSDAGCSLGFFRTRLSNDGSVSCSLCRCVVEANREELATTDPAPDVLPASGHRGRRPSVAAMNSFEKRFRGLLEFREIHGHTRVPRREGQLGDWVHKLRQRKDRLDEERLDRLNEIGFCWDASDDKRRKEREKWWERLESLRKTVQQQDFCRPDETEGSGDISTPVDATSSISVMEQEQSAPLSFENLSVSQKSWMRRQRIEYIESGRRPSQKLDEKQIQALNGIDPNWWQTVREKKWYAQYYALKDFKVKYGHCNVTNAHKNKKLFHWVQNTRKKYRAVTLKLDDGFRSDGTPKLSKAQIKLLDDICFNWDPWGHYAELSWLSDTIGPSNISTSLWD